MIGFSLGASTVGCRRDDVECGGGHGEGIGLIADVNHRLMKSHGARTNMRSRRDSLTNVLGCRSSDKLEGRK